MKVLLPLVLLSAALASGCDNQSAATTSTATTTSPTAAFQPTEVFAGTLVPLTTNVHTFTIVAVGQLNVILTAVGPPSTIFVGLTVGSPVATATGNTCTPLSGGGPFLVQASATPQIAGTVSAAGTYCVAISDAGNLTANVTYSISVQHT